MCAYNGCFANAMVCPSPGTACESFPGFFCVLHLYESCVWLSTPCCCRKRNCLCTLRGCSRFALFEGPSCLCQYEIHFGNASLQTACLRRHISTEHTDHARRLHTTHDTRFPRPRLPWHMTALPGGGGGAGSYFLEDTSMWSLMAALAVAATKGLIPTLRKLTAVRVAPTSASLAPVATLPASAPYLWWIKSWAVEAVSLHRDRAAF
jgi:hypothetical protein